MMIKISYEQMMKQLATMSKEDINEHLKQLGCSLSYDMIVERLTLTYNDLEVADNIFHNDPIHDDQSSVPKSFIDEVVLEIARRESFPFVHYGLISSTIYDIIEKHQCDMVDAMLQQYTYLFKLAKNFQLTSLEGLVYQINDGVDMLSATIFLLDEAMKKARNEVKYYKEIISFVEKFLHTFTKTSDMFKLSLQYEMAQAYIAMKSKKGEQLFLALLKSSNDVTEVVLHYALSYIDDDEKKAMRIIKRYRSLLDKESDSYETIQELIKDYE